MRVEEGAALDYSLDGQEPDCDIKPEVTNSNRRKCNIGDHPLLMWIKDRNLFLQELLRYEGCEWRGSYFMTISLKKLGLHDFTHESIRIITKHLCRCWCREYWKQQMCCAMPSLSTTSWLYALFVAIDANFCLKRCIVSKDSMDPSLSRGWAYFVEETAYKTYLQTCSGNTQQKSTCSSHNTVNMADSKVSHGLATTGVGTIDCAQHNMKLPNGVGDLQKGERMLAKQIVKRLNVDGQISTPWPLVPKKWDQAHGETYLMTILVTGTGRRLYLCKMTEANKEQEAHQTAFQELHKALAPKTTEAWTVEIESWEENLNDSLVTNPFKSKVIVLQAVIQAAIQLKLTQLEAYEL
ncbi:hypothetical protein DFJ58DRAFT_842202 [Suillus subalutaceus]|uniref:uncharacterized protein n=1 Tax=Suillus subalutaceus TaxID=48586 RepID=UPI001B8728F5|nr:uncharacterized protein DFJ58DRAFT_842202 [Suillus subalutaceus]KAG1851314.1 hypothetical protein DFJ58DRAFT_842202 [Suillus subalutaceus]